MSWSRNDIPDQSGRTAIVTGANSGLGYETTLALAAAGAEVIMACRSEDKARAAQAEIVREVPTAAVSVELLDLASLASVADFVGRMQERLDRLDLLINNAGVMATPPKLTEDGIEYQFACNHFGHFALTAGLMPQLRSAPESRVVALSSLAATNGSLSGHDPTSLDGYNPTKVYGATKLANQVFAVEFDRRLRAADSSIRSVAAHPGLSGTNLFDEFATNAVFKFVGGLATKVFTQSAARGALPTLMAATEPGVNGGSYFGPALPGQFYGPPKQIDVLSSAADPATGRELWDLSVEITGTDPTP